MPKNDSLESAIEQLYATFSRYQGDVTDRSPYAGITDADVAKLQSKPLRRLTVSALDRYVRSALTTWGGVEEFKHFLPRIFELMVRHPGAIDPLVLGKLELSEWRSWPRVEQDAVDGYLDALWRWALSASPSETDASDLLRGIGLTGHDMKRWLDIWRADCGLAATEQIAYFLTLVNRDLLAGDLPSYWHPKDRDAVLAFLRESNTRARIDAALAECRDADSRQTLANAAAILDSIHR